MPKLMLIDGNSLVNRAYYGVRPLSAPDGTPTNAVFGFLNILQRLLDDEKPDALCVMFDRREPTFRHKHSEAYKATRKPMPDDLAAQMPVLKDGLDALGIERRELSGWEADDLLGTVVEIDHGNDVVSVYANLDVSPAVGVGQMVACGDTVGAVGTTALAESGEEAHLHFAMRRGGSTVDPAEYVPET